MNVTIKKDNKNAQAISEKQYKENADPNALSRLEPITLTFSEPHSHYASINQSERD